MAQTLVFNVTRGPPELITPARPTPYEFKELSDIDDQASLRFQVPVIFVYRNEQHRGGSRDPAKVVKEAVAKALVAYYPFAGRLREKEGGKLVVECNGEGVMFIEANADVTLDEFGEDLKPPFPCLEELLFDVPGTTDVLGTPLLLIQVTRLKCGGFILAIRLNHTMADAQGLTMFMNAIAEFTRGAQALRIEPVWMRHLLSARNPPQVTREHREYEEMLDTNRIIVPSEDMAHKSVFFGPTEIATLKSLVPPHKNVSTFEIITACIWRCRIIALQPDPEELVRYICVVNFRNLLNSFTPSGYYGNAFALPASTSTAGELSTNPVGYAVDLVKRAKSRVTEEYMRSVADFMVLNGRPPFNAVGTFLVSDVTRSGFEDLDLGWGPPVFCGPAECGIRGVPGVVSFCMPYKNEKGEKGILVSLGLPRNAMDIFVMELNKLTGQDMKHPITNFGSMNIRSSSL